MSKKKVPATFGVFDKDGAEVSLSDGAGNPLVTAPGAQKRASELMKSFPDYGELIVRPLKEIRL